MVGMGTRLQNEIVSSSRRRRPRDETEGLSLCEPNTLSEDTFVDPVFCLGWSTVSTEEVSVVSTSDVSVGSKWFFYWFLTLS